MKEAQQIEKNRLLSSSDRPLFIQEFLYYKIFFFSSSFDFVSFIHFRSVHLGTSGRS